MARPHPRIRRPPRWPLLFHALLFSCALTSLLLGIVDIVLPLLEGRPPLRSFVEEGRRVGAFYLAVRILLHNFGLAALVPGLAFLAMGWERNPRLRRWIPLLLFLSIVASLGIAVEGVLSGTFGGGPYLPELLGIEVVAVGGLAVWGLVVFLRFVPTPELGWSLVEPARRLRYPALLSLALLGLASVIEVRGLMGS